MDQTTPNNSSSVILLGCSFELRKHEAYVIVFQTATVHLSNAEPRLARDKTQCYASLNFDCNVYFQLQLLSIVETAQIEYHVLGYN